MKGFKRTIRPTTIIFTSFLLLAICSQTAFAERLVVYSFKDNTIYEGAPFENNSCGAGGGMIAGRTNDKVVPTGYVRRGLVSFDLSAIPPGSAPQPGPTINGVSLTVAVDRSSAGSPAIVSLHKLISDWGEGASNCDASAGQGVPAVPPDATWLFSSTATPPPGITGVPWATAGGDFTLTASATTAVGTANGDYTWSGSGSTNPMVADVQSWVNQVNPYPNYGWMVIGEENGGLQTTYRFGTRESTTVHPPTLTVDFTPPDGLLPSPNYDACCVPTGVPGEIPKCIFATQPECINLQPLAGTFLTGVDECSTFTCDPSPRACCIANEDINFTCTDVSAVDCIKLYNGTPQGQGSSCRDTNVCGLIPWRDALPIPAVAAPVSGTAGGTATYNITMTEFQQQLHRDLPKTTVWGYNGSYPGPTVLASVNQPVTVKYINDLRDLATRQLRTSHYFTVDPCPHGPNEWRDAPRTVVHLHGAHVQPRFDGLPEYDFLPGAFDTYTYLNNQLGTTLWYHDHALGITRLNVMMGLAGFYLLRDADENRFIANNQLPSGAYEIGLALQDRDFNADGSLNYPSTAISAQMFHGKNILVNGKVWPYLNVDQGKYRLRVLNGSTSRTYTISFVNITNTARPTLPITVLGTEGGFYDAPRIQINGQPITEMTLGPAERFDIIVDFAGLARNTEIIMKNSAVTDFPGGVSPSAGTQNVLKFIVGGRTGFAGTIPATLRTFTPLSQTGATTRTFNLLRNTGPETCGGGEWLVQSLDANGKVIGSHWDDITDFPKLGGTEIWEFRNNSTVMHPMHIHDVHFQVLNRQAIDASGNPIGAIIPPEPLEVNAWKDTVKAMPNQVVRVILRFDDYLGTYPYHCHIIEHEDHEMMRQFQVVNLSCNNNGICESSEDCISCPNDCKQVSGASCGNRLCELGDGETSANCPADCAPDCGVKAFSCNTTPAVCAVPGFYCRDMVRVAACCGDSLCEGQETATNCAVDCGGSLCVRANPTVSITPTAQQITTNGGSVPYTVSVTNNDSTACSSTTFNLSVTDSDNGTNFVVPSTLSQNSVTLNPGASATPNPTLTVTAQPGKTSGSNSTTVTASDPAANHTNVTSNPVTTTISVVNCSTFTTKSTCNSNAACVWRKGVCLNR